MLETRTENIVLFQHGKKEKEPMKKKALNQNNYKEKNMKNINRFYAALITMTFGFSLISNVSAEDKNFLWESDGSLTIVDGAKDSGYIIEDGEVKTYVIPSDTEKTFIHDGSSGELIVCDPTIGCY